MACVLLARAAESATSEARCGSATAGVAAPRLLNRGQLLADFVLLFLRHLIRFLQKVLQILGHSIQVFVHLRCVNIAGPDQSCIQSLAVALFEEPGPCVVGAESNLLKHRFLLPPRGGSALVWSIRRATIRFLRADVGLPAVDGGGLPVG